jgi:hypothetical protein
MRRSVVRKLRVLARQSGIAVGAAAGVAIGVAALVTACGHASSSLSLAAGQTPGPATPSVTPSPVPVLGKLNFGTFPATEDGIKALTLCEAWSELRAQYVYRLQTDTPFELEQWFSSDVWQPAFTADKPLRTDPAYSEISSAFGLATTGQGASIASARLLDKACAAAD